MIPSVFEIIVIRNEKVVWKHWPNWSFFLYNLSAENSYNPLHASLHETKIKKCGKLENGIKSKGYLRALC